MYDVGRNMNTFSKEYIEFEKNISNLRRLSYGMRYLIVKKDEYIKWLKDEKGEIFPEKAFDQELWSTIDEELDVSNILIRTYIERYAFGKCGDIKKFLEKYKIQINYHKIEYQRNLPKLPILEINRDLRNYSVHSKPKYEYIQSDKTSVQILSEPVERIINNDSGEKEIVLLHDLNKESQIKEMAKASKKMSPSSDSSYSYITYGELLRDEILECIRGIDQVDRAI